MKHRHNMPIFVNGEDTNNDDNDDDGDDDEVADCGGYTPGTTRWYMGRTIRGGLARKIKARTSRLQVVLDIVIVPNRILYL